MKSNFLTSVLISLIHVAGLVISVELYNAQLWPTTILIILVSTINYIHGFSRGLTK